MKRIALLFVILCVTASTALFADDMAAEGRKIIDQYKDAIVTANLVLETKVSYQGGSDKEQHKVAATATMVDPSGLAVTSLSEIDPTSFSSYMDRDEGFNMTVDVIDLKLKMSDGTEIPADIVLRDKDLDLAFIKVKKAPEKPFTYVDLSNFSSPQVLDQLVVVSRLGKIANRSLAAYIDRIGAVITKPRTLYVVSAGLGLGCFAFTPDGKVTGLVTIRMDSAKDDDASTNIMGYGDSLFVVLPASTVAKTAKQAMEAVPAK